MRDAFDRINHLGPSSRAKSLALSAAVACALHGALTLLASPASAEMRPALDAPVESAVIDVSTSDVAAAVAQEPPPVAASPLAPAERSPLASALHVGQREDDPYASAAPAPSEAAKVLTSDDKNAFASVSGDGHAIGGAQAADGTGDKNVGAHASLASTPPPPPPPAAVAPPPAVAPVIAAPDQSRVAGLVGGKAWDCPFPAEADSEQIDDAVAKIRVSVAPDGAPARVEVVQDPGHGFGRAARQCAMRRRYLAALDRDGAPVPGVTSAITVRFTR
jgi:protein TonB